MAVTDVEIAVGRYHLARVIKFRHASQACIDQRRGHVVVALKQGAHCRYFIGQLTAASDQLLLSSEHFRLVHFSADVAAPTVADDCHWLPLLSSTPTH